MKKIPLAKIVISLGIVIIGMIIGGLYLLYQITNNFFVPPSTLTVNWYDTSERIEGTKEEYITIQQGTFTGEGDKYMRREVLTPWEQINSLDKDKDMFSRCGSGAYYNLNGEKDKKDAYYYGYITISKGCQQSEKIEFRIQKASATIDILDPVTKKYTAVQDWLKTAKPIDWDKVKPIDLKRYWEDLEQSKPVGL